MPRTRTNAALRATLLAQFAVGILMACAASPPDEKDSLAPGHAKVYVLRPAFSEVGRDERPTLLVNGRAATRLKHGSYTILTLPSGNYRLSVKPQPSESEAWNGQWQLTVAAAQVYYIAVWNDVEYKQETRAWYLGLPMPYLVTKGTSKTLRHELIAETEALPVIRTLSYQKPIAETHEPLR
jgi:hypothetical protein